MSPRAPTTHSTLAPRSALTSISSAKRVCPGKKAGEVVATAVHDFEGHQTYSEKPGHNFMITTTFDEIKAEDYDALVIPGGRAPEYIRYDEHLLHAVRWLVEAGHLHVRIGMIDCRQRSLAKP